MKLGFVGVLIAFGVASLGYAQTDNSSHPPQTGRFQIYELQYQDGISQVKHIDVFRIDTQTGETWKYISFVADGKVISLWAKIEERAESK